MGKLNPQNLKGLIERPGRYPDGQGLFFKTLGLGRAYWTYRYRSGGKEHETSLGPYPELSLEQARIKHAELRAMVLKGIDPVGDKRNAKDAVAAKADVPTFGQCADQYIAAHESGWKNPKHRQQWRMTLGQYCAPIRNLSVDQIDAKAVLRVLEPKWRDAPETMSRLRGRIEVILASAQVAGWIDPDKPNPARWKNWLDHMLPPPKKIGSRGHHAAMPYTDLPAFWTKLSETPGVAAKALMFTILTCARTSETLGMTWDEVSFASAVWRVPGERMKMDKPHDVPLSEQALRLLGDQMAGRGKNPFVFPSRPRQPLSGMAMAMAMRRMGAGEFTVHGMRSAARSWMADNGVEFELAEACLAHVVGNSVVQAYQRSSMLERRRPLMEDWAKFLSGETGDKVVHLKGRIRRPLRARS
jgi:integrase